MSALLSDNRISDHPVGWPPVVRLAASGTALVLQLPADQLPRVLHWGADPGESGLDQLVELARALRPPLATNGIDRPVPVSVLPESWTGWTGTVGVAGSRSGRAWSPRFVPDHVSVDDRGAEGGSVLVRASDAEVGLGLELSIGLLPSGLVQLRTTLTNRSPQDYQLDALTLALPVPERAARILDFAGRWADERVPQWRDFTVGTHLREGRHGRTGADAATLLTAGTADLGFADGEGWGLHVAFSGNHRVAAERVFTGERLLLGGELLLPGEIQLAPGASYDSPEVFAAYGRGLDAIANRFHTYLRARPQHPRSRRPVVMNVWEAVYFDHDLERLLDLAERGAAIGVERFVLDDGWFGSRRNDTSGLGDWVVSEDAWGQGRFARLVDQVKALGMEFGLWFEPEMVNLDSDLARAHPEWLLQVPGRLPIEARHQQVLDLTHPGAFEHVRNQIVALVHEYGIDYLKWDHNRDLVDSGSTRTGRAGVHAQTLAAYRLLDRIRRECPGLEIESCSSGGSRVDLGILQYTDRVWASDCIDAHERQQIQRWTAQLLPPELVGSHVGADQAHTTGRRHDLSFRAATALFGHFGIEWDLSSASAEELAELAEWVGFYKQVRPLLHNGTTVRRDLAGGALWLHGLVSPERDRALYQVAVRARPVTWPVGPVRLAGLDRGRTYRVSPAGPGPQRDLNERVHPDWWATGLLLPGSMLEDVGFQVPALHPDHVALILVEAES